ncbi:MAG: hypothetical protein AB1405_15035 [Bdellovibrionota bacterium]
MVRFLSIFLRWIVPLLFAGYVGLAIRNNLVAARKPPPGQRTAIRPCTDYESVYLGIDPAAGKAALEVESALLVQFEESGFLGKMEEIPPPASFLKNRARKSLERKGTAVLAQAAKEQGPLPAYFTLVLVDRCRGTVTGAAQINMAQRPSAIEAAALRSQIFSPGKIPSAAVVNDTIFIEHGLPPAILPLLQSELRLTILQTELVQWAEPDLLKTLAQWGLPSGDPPVSPWRLRTLAGGETDSLWSRVELYATGESASGKIFAIQDRPLHGLFNDLPELFLGFAPQ